MKKKYSSKLLSANVYIIAIKIFTFECYKQSIKY